MTYNITCMPGDGVGPEIVNESIKIMKAVQQVVTGFDLNFQYYDAGAGYYSKSKTVFPNAAYDACKTGHAIFIGAMGIPEIRDRYGVEIQAWVGITLRKELNLFAGVRPVKLFKGVNPVLNGINFIDMVVLREQSEGLFSSFGGGFEVYNKVVGDTLVITREGSTNISEYAFKLARKRKGRSPGAPTKVTCVDKSNIFRSYAFFRNVFFEVAKQYPDIECESIYMDAMSLYCVQRPNTFDVLVTENQFGDILSDLCSGVAGGMGIAPAGEFGFDHGMFQSAHGSAPALAGQNIVNPVAQILSAAMMLDWLGEKYRCPELEKASKMMDRAVQDTIADGYKTCDLGGRCSTTAFGDKVIEYLKREADL
jgi:3-isopropylmalate dehydrogenase